MKMYRFLKGVQVGRQNFEKHETVYSNQLDEARLKQMVKRGILQEIPVAEPEPIKPAPPMQTAMKLSKIGLPDPEPEPEVVVEESEEVKEEVRKPETKPARRSAKPTRSKVKSKF